MWEFLFKLKENCPLLYGSFFLSQKKTALFYVGVLLKLKEKPPPIVWG